MFFNELSPKMTEKLTFGQYITSEYSILKGIFGSLNAKELLTASHVCKDWQQMACRVMRENAVPTSYICTLDHALPAFNDKFIPRIILHLTANYDEDEIDVDALSSRLPLEKTEYFTIRSFGHIGSMWENGRLYSKNLLTGSPDSYLLLPEMEGVHIKTHIVLAGTGRQPQLSEESCEEIERSKGLVLVVNMKRNRSRKEVENLLKRIKRNSDTCVVAGGLANKSDMIKYHTGDQSTELVPLRMFAISFSGENISIVSDVVLKNEDVNEFMQNLAEKVGPLPPNAVRIAFIFICVNRRMEPGEKEETEIFAQHFPDVPIYGFWSLGEYCVRSPGKMTKESSEGSKRRKVSSVQWYKDTEHSFAECSSVLVLTFQRPKRSHKNLR